MYYVYSREAYNLRYRGDSFVYYSKSLAYLGNLLLERGAVDQIGHVLKLISDMSSVAHGRGRWGWSKQTQNVEKLPIYFDGFLDEAGS